MKQYDRAALIISPFCDNDCIFCGNHPRCSDEELANIEAAIYGNLNFHLLNGATDFEISGGDPGEYDRLPELIAELKRNGAQVIRLSTNGYRCSDPEWLQSLVDAGLNEIKIPLYGSRPEIHQRVARKSGSFKAATRALELSIERGIGISINTLIVRQNSEDLINLHRLMLQFTEWRRCHFSIPCLSGVQNDFYIPIKDLRYDCVPLIYSGVMNETPPVFTELPLCVFGFDYPFINKGGPPRQGLQQPPEPYRSQLEDIPTYRLKQKPLMCADCRMNSVCQGFFKNDLERFGAGDLQPFLV